MYPYQYPFYSQANQPSSGFVSVRSIQEAQNYPVAPGNSVMFRDEYAPYVYTKTMGQSQLDRPTFEKYRLVKEEVDAQPSALYASISDVEALRVDVDNIKRELGLEGKNESA